MISITRIKSDLARRFRKRVPRIVAGDDLDGASDDLRCVSAVFGHGDGVPGRIDRVR